MIYSEELTNIYLEVVAGVPGPKDERAEAKDTRERITRQVRELKAQGMLLEIPNDIGLD